MTYYLVEGPELILEYPNNHWILSDAYMWNIFQYRDVLYSPFIYKGKPINLK